jgi:hypothetical protein
MKFRKNFRSREHISRSIDALHPLQLFRQAIVSIPAKREQT